MTRKKSLHAGVAVLVALGLSTIPGLAVGQTSSTAPAGAFIFQRDVAPRAAQAKEPPGTPHYVALDQSALIVGALGNGLAPLADNDIQNVSAASSAGMTGALGNPEASALANLPNDIGSSTNALRSGGPSAPATAAINIPLQSISDAMSTLKAALGGH